LSWFACRVHGIGFRRKTMDSIIYIVGVVVIVMVVAGYLGLA
jgi:hypothetical protein